MTLTALGGMNVVRVGGAHRQGTPSLAALAATLCDAAKEACIMFGQMYWADGASHTVDTTGSSKFEWRTGAVTFANSSTRVKVGLAVLDTTTGPPARAANATDVITFDVSTTHVGNSGTITANAWQSNTPDSGTKTIAHGGFCAFAVQLTVLGGVDLVNVTTEGDVSTAPAVPGVTSYTGGTYANTSRLPNCIVTSSDGVQGVFYGGFVASVGSTTQTWNSGSGQVEYGNFFQFPVPTTVYGIFAGVNVSNDCDLVLYSAPTGTPSPMATVSVDANAIAGAAAGGDTVVMFTTPQQLAANTLYFASVKPGASNVGLNFKTYNAAADQAADFLGTNCYAGSRATGGGAFAAQNSSKDRFAIGLLVGAFDNGLSGPLIGGGRLVG